MYLGQGKENSDRSCMGKGMEGNCGSNVKLGLHLNANDGYGSEARQNVHCSTFTEALNTSYINVLSVNSF